MLVMPSEILHILHARDINKKGIYAVFSFKEKWAWQENLNQEKHTKILKTLESRQ